MNTILSSIIASARIMSWVEILANITALVSVILSVQRRVSNYPIGIISTIAFFFVFWSAGLYSSALLQVFFTLVQIYGWWFWLKGADGAPPPITRLSLMWIVAGAVVAIGGGLGLSAVTRLFGAKMALADSLIFSLSVVAQVYIDRKKLENWLVWFAVDAVSIWVYGAQGLYLTTCVYVVFLLNTAYGFYEWRKAYRGQNRL